MPTALVTGSAGFIGYHLCARLLKDGWDVVGLDGLTDYYDVQLKKDRLARLESEPGFSNVTSRLEDRALLADMVARHRPQAVIHLAAQAGVRYSIENPQSYVDSNLIGTFNLLEAVRAHPPAHVLLASTSSVYGANEKMPYAETDKADTQLSFYAATKKANEAMAHSYAHLYDIPTTAFRFFTVYGPWGRPDMAHFKFTRAILDGEPIQIYNHGKMQRDFTYIDDLVEGLVRLIPVAPVRPALGEDIQERDSLSAVAPFRILNIGNAQPTALMDFVAAIEKAVGRPAEKQYMQMQPGDVQATWADVTLLARLTGFTPSTSVESGVEKFVDWYREYFGK